MRRSRNIAAGKASALDDLARRKETGESRAVDYEVEEEAPLYDVLDDKEYKERVAANYNIERDFIVPDAARKRGEDDDDDDDQGGGYLEDLEQEFAFEAEQSHFEQVDGRKRKRGAAGGNRRRGPTKLAKPVKRLEPAFFNAAERAATRPANIASTGDEPSVFDKAELDREFEAALESKRTRRKKQKSSNAGMSLFDPIPATASEFKAPPMIPEPDMDDALPSQEVDFAYDAPPPSFSLTKVPSIPQAPQDSVELSDDALIAAADAAIAKRETPVKPARSLEPTMKPSPIAMPRPTVNASVNKPAMPANTPLARDTNGDLFLFWTDAQDVRVNGGEYLYLFGKSPLGHVDSGVFASVCVQVKGLERKLYVLPRAFKVDGRGAPTQTPVKIIPDVYNEVKDRLLGKVNGRVMGLGGAAAQAAASNLPSELAAKVVKRSSPFCDPDAPREASDYLKIKIPYNKACKLNTDSHGETFVRVYGSKTSSAEALALKRGLKGPSWLRISGTLPSRSKVTHARHSLFVDSPMKVTVASDLHNRPPPPLSMLCLSTKTILNAKTGGHEVVMVAGVFVREVPLVGALDQNALEAGGPNGTKDFVLVRAPENLNIPFGFRDRANSSTAGGGVEVLPNEPALLNNLLTKLLRLDPDVLMAHDLMGFGLDVLLARMQARRSRDWSRLGRLVQSRGLSHAVRKGVTSSWFKEDAVAGRLAVDTLAASREFMMGEKEYSLTALSHNVLAAAVPKGPGSDRKRSAIALATPTDVTKVPEMFGRADTLCKLVAEVSHEARTTGRLAAHLNVLPLTKQLTCISGNLWSRTLRGARAERIEYLLCHELRLIGRKKAGDSAKAGNITTKLLIPDKLTKTERFKLSESIEMRNAIASGKDRVETRDKKDASASKKSAKKGRRKPQYSGGLVLEPKKGLYDHYVLQLDFNSLYPSIIQEFNICFTTLDLKVGATLKKEEDEADGAPVPPKAPLVGPGRTLLDGVLPRVLRRLIQQRREVKRALKDERSRAQRETLRAQQLDTRQLAIKLTANSLYGCLGFEGSRFFARPLAELVTLQGRETLQKTVEISRDSFNAEVIYGDTDSIFVNTGLNDIATVRRMGTELKREVNKRYHTLEIEIDAIYRKMLLLKKKKYAALKVVDPTRPQITVREVKGLDLVRHDWCDLSHDASEHFLTQIFASASANVDDAVGNIITFLTDLKERVSGNQVALGKYVITRALTKSPNEYPDAKNLPHVQVAMRMKETLKRHVQVGDYIKYVVCVPADLKGPTPSGNIATRSYHPDEVMNSGGKLVIDVKYYLENQVLPPIMRLAEPIESVERSRLATSLGLDGRRFERSQHEQGDDETLALGMVTHEADKYRDCDVLNVICNNCGKMGEFKGVIFGPRAKGIRTTGLNCEGCGKRLRMAWIENAVSLHVRGWMHKYYCSPFEIDGAERGMRSKLTRNVSLGGVVVRRQFDEAWLYTQLRYLHFVMDLDGRWKRAASAAAIDPDDLNSRMPVSVIDQQTYKALLDRVDRVFDRNAFRFVDIADFLAPLGIA